MTDSIGNGDDPPQTLNIISLNCWGLKYIAKYRQERLLEIGVQLAAAVPRPDIVGLQECWTQQDYLAIREKTKDFLPHGKFYFSGIFGGGLAILSRWPIEESNMFRYPLNGRPSAFYRGDWFVGKGVASARIRMGPNKSDIAEVFTTHLHAPYEAEPHDSYLCHRTAQAWEIAKKMRHAAERGHLVIALGDFNVRAESLAHSLLQAHTPCRDVWQVIYPDSSVGSTYDAAEQKRGVSCPSAEYNLSYNGATCDSVLNTWRWEPSQRKRLERGENVTVDDSIDDPGAKRLDYIFVATGGRPPVATDSADPMSADWSVSRVKVGMTGRHPTLHCSLSDHFSVECTLARTPLAASPTRPPNTLSEASSVMTQSLPVAVYDHILEMTQTYTLRERRQRQLRLGHFCFQLCLSIGCHIAVWWSSRPYPGISFLLMFLSTLGLSVGTIDGLIGGLFIGSELRALKEFEWEIETTRRVAAGSEPIP